MKKLAIAGASLALAAMPVVGVFAEPTPVSFTDDLTITVNPGCTIQETTGTGGSPAGTHNDRSFAATIVAGDYKVLRAGEAASGSTTEKAMEIICNSTDDSKQWTVSATSINEGKLQVEGDTSKFIAGGVATSGATSTWAYSVDGGTNWNPVAATMATVKTGTASTTATEFNPIYQVYVAPTQAAGQYKGSVTYTVALP